MPKKQQTILPIGKPWSISGLWNQCFNEIETKKIEPRDYVYASEVGHSFINVYYKMKGEPYTNYPTSVAKMKMEAGSTWEGIVKMVLTRAGIMQDYQKKIDFNLPKCISVHGRLDFIGGGAINIEQITKASLDLKELYSRLHFPQIYTDIADRALQGVMELATNGTTYLELIPLEVKSLSRYVWDMIESTHKAAGYHVSQLFHYIKGLNMPKGRLIYINRDDTRLMEMDVLNEAKNLKSYTDWITQMTYHWINQDEPEREPLIGFNTDDFKFRKKTMEIEWSPYLTLIYGYKSPMEYREHVDKPIKSFNRVFKRCVDSSNMTDNNKTVIKEAKVFFPLWDDYVDMAKEKAKAGELNLEEVIE